MARIDFSTSTAATLAETPRGRTYLRTAAGMPASDRTPVDLVDGDAAPQLTGRGYYWTTPSGKTIVHHPNAYGWRTVYHHSTYAITVGRDWRPAVEVAAAA